MPPGDAIAQAAGQMPDLRILVMQIPFSNRGLEASAGQGKLQSLRRELAEVNDHSLELAGRLSALRQLRLGGPGKLTDAGMAPLGNLTRMVDLSVPVAGIGDAGLAHLASLKAIEYLNLAGSRVTGSGLAALQDAKSLKSLMLTDAPFDDAGCRLLAQLTSLESLDLSGTKIGESGLESIAGLVNLRELMLDGTAVTDAALANLDRLTKLQLLYVLDTALGPEAIGDLKAAIPGLKVVADFKVLASFGNGSLLIETSDSDRVIVKQQGAEMDASPDDEMVEFDGDNTPGPPEDSDRPDETDAAEQPANGQSPAGQQALAKLRTLGATWENQEPSADGRHGYGRDVRLVVKFWQSENGRGWEGTAEDWKLLEAIDKPEHLLLAISTDRLVGLADVRFARPLAGLMLTVESAEQAAQITRLPRSAHLHLDVGSINLPLDAFRRVIAATDQVEDLQLMITSGNPGEDGPLVEGDDALVAIAGVMKSLKRISVSRPLTRRGLDAVVKIEGLEGLAFSLVATDPDDVEPLSRLANLQVLWIAKSYDNGAFPRDNNQSALGDAVARAVATLPKLDELTIHMPVSAQDCRRSPPPGNCGF